jgi:hypothetical protein
MSRLRPSESKPTIRTHGSAFGNTPEMAAAEAGAPTARALELSRANENNQSFRGGEGSLTRTRAASSMTSSRDLPVVKTSSKEPPKTEKKSGFLRRISFMPGLGSKKDDNSAFPGIYASFVIVPYVLPPPPQPPKHPPPGSNDERRLQRQNLKRMFLEDLYSQVLELADEKIRLNETCRDLEAQITESDAQINMLIGANDQ